MLHFKRSVCLAVLALFACTEEDPESCVDNFCNVQSLPYCDRTGAVAGTPGVCIAVECEPNTFDRCLPGDIALTCNAFGTSYIESVCESGCDAAVGCEVQVACTPNTTSCGDGVINRCSPDSVLSTETCLAGCIEAPEPHCALASPKFLPDVCDEPSDAPALAFGSFDTNNVAACNGGVIPQAGGPALCVVRASSIAIAEGVRAEISGANALMLVSDGDLVVAGTLDVSGNATRSGAGGGTLAPSGGVASTAKGGGGAGYTTTGGSGASETLTAGAANAGPAYLGTGEVLLGGFRSASDTPTSACGLGSAACAPPGSAGGAVSLVSCSGVIRVPGTIAANGGGGFGGGVYNATQAGRVSGGAGGGSGGTVVLQGLDVQIYGRIYANGGGGGNGRPASAMGSVTGTSGGNGQFSTMPSVVPPAVLGEGRGGAGGTGTTAPGHGTAPTDAMATPGGGGGSVGVFRVVVPSTIVPRVTTKELSPKPGQAEVLPVR